MKTVKNTNVKFILHFFLLNDQQMKAQMKQMKAQMKQMKAKMKQMKAKRKQMKVNMKVITSYLMKTFLLDPPTPPSIWKLNPYWVLFWSSFIFK